LSRVGVLWDTNAPGLVVGVREYEAAARSLKLQLYSLEVRGPNPDLAKAFQAAMKARAGAVVAIFNPVLDRYRIPIADFAIKNQLPSKHEESEYVLAGGL